MWRNAVVFQLKNDRIHFKVKCGKQKRISFDNGCRYCCCCCYLFGTFGKFCIPNSSNSSSRRRRRTHTKYLLHLPDALNERTLFT